MGLKRALTLHQTIKFQIMIREIVKIDESKCTGCGLCVPGCHEGALQIIDGKARLISELMCDGLGACIGHCPEGAITIEKREAVPYDEIAVIQDMIEKGKNTVVAHLIHLREHNQDEYFVQAINWLENNKEKLGFDLNEVKTEVHKKFHSQSNTSSACGCPGSATRTINKQNQSYFEDDIPSALTHWPIQMHLINPTSAHFKNSDLLIASDCSAFSMGGFHSNLLKGKTLVVLCPKLDKNQDIYVNKLVSLIRDARVNTISCLMMEVPCCGGIISLVREALQIAGRKVPVKAVILSIDGKILEEEWI